MVGVAATTDRLVAVGSSRQGNDYQPLLWTSDDGTTWQRVDSPGGIDRGWILSVVAGDDGFVAVGTAIQDDHALATAWHSPDGLTWRVETDPPLDGGVATSESLARGTRNLQYGGMQDIDLRQDGRAVAVGARCRPDGAHCHPRVWVRGPGGGWDAVELGIDPNAIGELTAVTSIADRTIAVGTDRAGRAIAFTSLDLARWRPMVMPADPGRGAATFTDVTAAGDQVMGFLSDGTDIAIWRWTDGDGWEPLHGDEGPPARVVLGSTLIGGHLMVAGRRPGAAALWIAEEAPR
jgi:hypothetical protein